MVLSSFGDARTEAQLASALGSYDFGTPASHIKLLETLGYRVQYGPSSLEDLQAHLSQGLFPIVFVRADMQQMTLRKVSE